MIRAMWLVVLVGCGGPKVDETGDTTECPGDRGMPAGLDSPVGRWSASWAADYYDDTCAVGGIDRDSEAWIGSFTLDGNVPEAIYLYFEPDIDSDTEIFYGVVDEGGGVSFTGVHAHTAGTMYAQFGGLLYFDQYQSRYTIDGSATLGLDVDQDGLIDCAAKGSWVARKSG